VKTPFSRVRRVILALAALFLSALAFRSQISQAVVVRGDDMLYRNRLDAARDRYRRALAIDPSSETAVDRYVFASMERRTPNALAQAISIASTFLKSHPKDGPLLADRALCYLLQHRYRQALNDFRDAAARMRDPRYYVFAGWCARRLGERSDARSLWEAALMIRSGFRPALAALRRLPK
jgi:tetratricopeptide (TPR) repeat protein